MSIVHSFEGAGHEPARPTRLDPSGSTTPPRPPPSMRPIDMGPLPPAWSRSAKSAARVQIFVQSTLFVVIVGLLTFIATLPRPLRMHAWVEAERPVIELRLSLAELRAIISDYRTDHGAYPGCDANGSATPRWFAQQWQRAIERAEAEIGKDAVRRRASDANGGIPMNPINGLSTVRFLSSTEPWPARADDTTGWVYRPATGEIRANCTGNAFGSGPAYWDL